MKAGLYLLIGLAALALLACDGKMPQQTRRADPEKLAQYTKHISRKWHFDVPFMERELKAYRDTVFRIANQVSPGGFANYAVNALDGPLYELREEIKYSHQEFFPDKRVLYKSLHGAEPWAGQWAFDSKLDTLYFISQDGHVETSYKIAALSDTALIEIRDLYLPTKELKDMTKRRFYKLRCKYVPE